MEVTTGHSLHHRGALWAPPKHFLTTSLNQALNYNKLSITITTSSNQTSLKLQLQTTHHNVCTQPRPSVPRARETERPASRHSGRQPQRAERRTWPEDWRAKQEHTREPEQQPQGTS